MDTAVSGFQEHAKTSMTDKCIEADSLEQWHNEAEPSMVMMSLLREEAQNVWKVPMAAKGRSYMGLL